MTAGSASLTLATWRGRRILSLLCAVAFLDFTDASITNVALPHIRAALGFSVQDLQWVPSAYLLTYGGFMLLGGRLADLIGRRSVILAGTSLVAVASLVGGFAGDAGVFVGARFAQGLGAALMLPAALATGGMLALVFALVRAPEQGWGAASTWGELGGAAVLLAAFGVNERKARDPLLPLGIFRTRGLLAANVTGFVGFSGLLAMFYFLTLYMQNVLGYSPVAAGAAYLPLTFAVGVSSGIGAKLATRIGSRPVIVGSALIAAAGLFLLGHVPVHGTYPPDILPGLLLVAFGIGPVFVGVTSAANAGVPAGQAGVAAAIMNSFQQTGGALGLAIMSAVATSQATHSLARGLGVAQAATSGYQHALLTGCWLAAGAAVLALWTVNSREDPMTAGHAASADHDLLTL